MRNHKPKSASSVDAESQEEISYKENSKLYKENQEVIKESFKKSVKELPERKCTEPEEVSVEEVEPYIEQLQCIFQKYCSYGEPLNTTRLKSAKFMKLLKDAGLVSTGFQSIKSKLKPVEIDLIYSKVTGIKHFEEESQMRNLTNNVSVIGISSDNMITNQMKGPKILNFNKKRTTTSLSHTMEFCHFIKALHLISQKLAAEGDSEQNFNGIIESCILPLNTGECNERVVSNETLVSLMELINEKEMAEFLDIVHKSLYPYYKSYCKSNGLLTLSGFTGFCTDFEIFPDIISKPRLNHIFNTISAIIESGNKGKSKSKVSMESHCIDDNMFIQVIALCALEVPYKNPQPNNFEKVLKLII